MSDIEYWKECLMGAAEECELILTDIQADYIADCISRGHENYSMAFGYDCIPNPIVSEAERKLRILEEREKQREEWEDSTEPCKFCTTRGSVHDGWGRDVRCPECNGKGRVRKYFNPIVK